MIFLVERDFMSTNSIEEKRFYRFMEHVKHDGYEIFEVSSEFRFCKGKIPELMFSHIPRRRECVAAIWFGYVIRPEDYASIHEKLAEKNICLIHDPSDHEDLMVFNEDSYKDLAFNGMTAKSRVIFHEDEIDKAVEAVGGYPVFVKGGIQSLKTSGVDKCILHNREELEAVAKTLLYDEFYQTISCGRVVIREYQSFLKRGITAYGFPQAMEIRYFYWDSQQLGRGWYWRNQLVPPLSEDLFSFEEQIEMRSLVESAVEQFDGTFMAVDIAKTSDRGWQLVEVGDAQFAGFMHVEPGALWKNMSPHIKNWSM